MSEERKERRVCIVGTAPTWRQAPWDDPSVEMWLLNDMHVLNPPRADAWYDLHPFDQMYFRSRDKKIYADQVPVGHFVRPEGHIDWLRKQTIPVYVQDAKLLGSPSARTFPYADVVKALGPNFASSPAWMVGHALLEGVTELLVYGIHLATEWEYTKQKPNLSFLLGVAAGKGVKITIPGAAPLLRESHLYAYESDPDLKKLVIQRRMQHLEQQRAIVKKQIAARKWYARADPNHASRLAWLNAQIADAHLALQTVLAGRSPVGV